MNMEQLKEFVCLETRKREPNSELKAIGARIDDGRTVYIAQDIQASPANDRAEVIGALKQSELGQYISEKYNTQSLRAFVREVAEEVQLRCQQQDRLFSEEEVRVALPAPLCDSLKISFVHSLRSRKA